MKRTGVTLFFTLLLVFLSFSISFADPSGLIVVRASDNSLWKATCVGLTCTGFTSFPGMFASQPTVYWDESIYEYVVWGRASDNSIWRATFNIAGSFNNDWVSVPGATASPIAAAGGGLFTNFNSQNNNDTTSGIALTTTATNIVTMDSYAPYGGFFACTGAGTIEHYRTSSSGTDFARVYLTQTSGGTPGGWNFTDVPSGTPVGYTSFPFSIQRWFAVSAGTNYFYVTGEIGGTASGTTTTTAKGATLTCEFFPYAY